MGSKEFNENAGIEEIIDHGSYFSMDLLNTEFNVFIPNTKVFCTDIIRNVDIDFADEEFLKLMSTNMRW